MKSLLLALALLFLTACKVPSTDPAENLATVVEQAAQTADSYTLVGAIDRENGTILLTSEKCDRSYLDSYAQAFYVSNGKNEDVGAEGVTYEGCWKTVGKTRILIEWSNSFKPAMYSTDKIYDPDAPRIEVEVKK